MPIRKCKRIQNESSQSIMNQALTSNQHPILFYDGDCLLCSHTIQWLMPRSVHSGLRFAPLSGQTAKELLPPSLIQETSSLVLWEYGQMRLRSAGVFATCQYLKFPWRLFQYLRVLPLWLTDPAYRLIARNRHRLYSENAAFCVRDSDNRILP